MDCQPRAIYIRKRPEFWLIPYFGYPGDCAGEMTWKANSGVNTAGFFDDSVVKVLAEDAAVTG